MNDDTDFLQGIHQNGGGASLESDTADDFFYPMNTVADKNQNAALESATNPQNNATVVTSYGSEPSINTYIQIRQKGDAYYLYIDAGVLTVMGPEEYAISLMVWLRSFPEDTQAHLYIYVFCSAFAYQSDTTLSENPRLMYFPPSQSRINAFLMTNARTTFVLDRMVNHIESYIALCADEIVFQPSGVLIIRPIHVDEKHPYFQKLSVFHKYLYNLAYERGYLTDEDYANLINQKRVVKYSPDIENMIAKSDADAPEDDTTT